MMDHEALHALTKLELQIKDRLYLLSEALLKGSAKDFTEYKYIVGQMDGLRCAMLFIQTLARGDEDEDEFYQKPSRDGLR
jgi:hypothetical protein